MNKCHVCGSNKFYHDFVDEVFYISGKPILVEHIPTKICNQCSEQIFNCQTTEQIRLILHSEAKPVSLINLYLSDCVRSQKKPSLEWVQNT